MKVYFSDFNGLMWDLKDKFELAEDIRDADVIVLWQDVRGAMLDICKINNEYLHKPLVVIQHGRGATRDYLPPNSFKMNATKFCCWGSRDYERLVQAGYGDRAVITGSPLVKRLQARLKHPDKNIVFVPVITSHEEPENIVTFWELKRIEYKYAQKVLEANKDKLKDEWHAWNVNPEAVTDGSIPYYNINRDWRVIAKITGVHDKHLYFGDVVQTLQQNVSHIDDCMRLLTMTDCVVGMEEGTFQLLAMAINIPVVMVDGFQYKNYGGVDYSKVEMIKTNAAKWTDLEHLEETINNAMANPDDVMEERRKVLQAEFCPFDTDAVENIVKVIKEVGNG